MLSNISEFMVLLERYEDDPAVCSKLIRSYASTNTSKFLEYARAAVLAKPVSRGLRFITNLALSNGLVESVFELYLRSREEALSYAKKIVLCDPRFDFAIMEFLQGPHPADWPQEVYYHTGLEILDLISESDRMIPSVLKVLKHPNAKIRSKAAMFVGRRTQNLAWAASHAQEFDARVRANILESLFGMKSDFVHQLFRNHVTDENNRVAGNAVYGLYQLHDPVSISLVDQMMRNPDPNFRNTAAWVMGKTGDSRFTSVLAELMQDPNEIVRKQAFRGLAEVKKATRVAMSKPPLQLSIFRAESNDLYCGIAGAVQDCSGQPVRGIPPTSFIVKTGSRFVREYAVEEHESRGAVSIGFVMCLPTEGESAMDQAFREAIEACSPLRRAKMKDRWTIVKLGWRPQGEHFEATSPASVNHLKQKWSLLPSDLTIPLDVAQNYNFEYSAMQERLDAMLQERPTFLSGVSDEKGADVAIDHLLRVDISWGKPHLIFLGGSATPFLVDSLLQRGQDVPAIVHVVGLSQAWESPEVLQLVDMTGGYRRSVAKPEDMARACVELYSAILHHYKITWREGSGDIELTVSSENGRGSAVYSSKPATFMPESISA